MSSTYPKLVQDENYPELCYVEWPDGTISDMVNKTRAKEAIRRFEEVKASTDATMPLRASRKPAGEFK